MLLDRQQLLRVSEHRFWNDGLVPGDDRERTYLQLLIEGQAKAAIKGNVEAAKLLLRYAASCGQQG